MELVLLIALGFVGLALTALVGTVVSFAFVLLQSWVMALPERLHRFWLRSRLPRLAHRLAIAGRQMGADGAVTGTREGCAVELSVRDAVLRADSGMLPAQYLLTVRASSAVTEMPRRWLALQSASPVALGAEGPSAVRRLLRPDEVHASDRSGGLTTRSDGLSCWFEPGHLRGLAAGQLGQTLSVMVGFIHLLEDARFMESLEQGALRSEEPWMRRWALRTLLRLDPTLEVTRRVSEALAADPDPYVRLEALSALADRGVGGLIVMATQHQTEDAVRAEAIRRWLASPMPPDVPALVGLLEGTEPLATVAILQTLGAQEDLGAEAPILECLRAHARALEPSGPGVSQGAKWRWAEHDPIFEAAAEALARIGGPRSAQALGALAEDLDQRPGVRATAASALLRVRSRIAGHAAGRLSVAAPEFEAIGHLSEPEAGGALSEPEGDAARPRR